MFLYIDSHLSYKQRPDLNIYNGIQLEPTFLEIINPKEVMLSLAFSTNIKIWMLWILNITIQTKFLKLYAKNENRCCFLMTLI